MNFNTDYIRVEKPVTKDGRTLMYDDERRPIFKSIDLPISAKKELEKRNEKLPEELRLKITVMKDEAVKRPLPVVPPPPDTVSFTPEQLAKLIDEKIALAMGNREPDAVAKKAEPVKTTNKAAPASQLQTSNDDKK